MKIKSLRYKINTAIFITCVAVAVIFAAILYPNIISSHDTQLKNVDVMLDYAYIGGRYDPEYKISKEDLEYLSGRVKLLMELTEKFCHEKIESLKKTRPV